MKLYKAILHTAGKTDKQIQDKELTLLSPKELALTKRMYEAWDGVKCLVANNPFGTDDNQYIYINYLYLENRAKAKDAIYLMEQDAMFGAYINRREDFDRDYDAGDYDPGGSIVFDSDEVEILGELQDGDKPDGHEPVPQTKESEEVAR